MTTVALTFKFARIATHGECCEKIIKHFMSSRPRVQMTVHVPIYRLCEARIGRHNDFSEPPVLLGTVDARTHVCTRTGAIGVGPIRCSYRLIPTEQVGSAWDAFWRSAICCGATAPIYEKRPNPYA